MTDDTINKIKKLLFEYYMLDYESVLEEEATYKIDLNKDTKHRQYKNDMLILELMYLQLSDKEIRLLELRHKYFYSSIESARIMYLSQSTYYRTMKEIYKKLLHYYIVFRKLCK